MKLSFDEEQYGKAIASAFRLHKKTEEANHAERCIERGRNITIDLDTLTNLKLVDDLIEAVKGADEMAVLQEYRAIVGKSNAKCGSLKLFPLVLSRFLRKACTHSGWLFRQEDTALSPLLPTEIEYRINGRGTPPDVMLTCVHNTLHLSEEDNHHEASIKEHERHFYFTAKDIRGRYIADVLAEDGLRIETDDLHRQYDEQRNHWRAVCNATHEAFNVVGPVAFLERGVDISRFARPEIIVNDMAGMEWDDSLEAHSFIYDADKPVPHELRAFGFHLRLHEPLKFLATNATPFEYVDITDKLVLPGDQEELVTALVHELHTIRPSDFVEGKSTGTPVLCKGAPGLGKTTLAEVTARRVKRPLYKIKAGALLSDTANRVKNVEQGLRNFLLRSERMKLIPLIDECDVMVATRQTSNLDQAAIVTAFLTSLEYFNGLLFMTTNRQDIDDAVESRAAAIIVFESPDEKGRLRMWEIQDEAQSAGLDKKTMTALSKLPCSGRDITRLLSLAIKYRESHKLPLTVDLIKKIARYRGINW